MTFLSESDKYPNFNLESYLRDQGVEFQRRDADDHAEICFNCPKCVERGESRPDRKQRFWMNTEKGKFICYNCGWAGDMPRLVMHYSSTNFEGAIKILRGTVNPLELLNFKLTHDEYGDIEESEQTGLREVQLPYGFQPFEHGGHGIFSSYLEKRGVPLEYAVANDWGFSTVGYTKYRLIVPTYMEDMLVFWQARDVLEGSHELWGTSDYRKVLNPKGVSARSVLYQFDSAKVHGEIILCEGFMDAVKAGPNAVATNGKKLHPSQLEWLIRTKAKNIVILWDSDAHTDEKYFIRGAKKGNIKSVSSVETARSLLQNYFDVKVVRLPDGRDPGDYGVGELDPIITGNRRLQM